jgi:hypothetical protein
MSKATTTIELPRLEGESSRAYQARVEYITAGPQRDLRTLAQKLDKSLTIVGRWSSQYGWVELAKQYDSEVSYLTVQEAAEQHRADLASHREKAMTSAKNLMALAGGLTRIMGDALTQPRKVEGKDGKVYTLHKVIVDANTLTTISKALQTALDLEAHALGIDQIEETRD